VVRDPSACLSDSSSLPERPASAGARPSRQETTAFGRRAPWIGILFALGSALSFGIGHFTRKLAVIEVPSPFWGMAIGTTAAWSAMAVQAMAQGEMKELCRNNFNRQAPPWIFIVTGVLNTVGQMFIYIAIFFTNVSVTQVLATSEILATLLLSRLMLKGEEPLGLRIITCSLVVFGGVILMFIG